MADANPRGPNPTRGRLLTILIVAALFAIGAFQILSGSRGYITTAMDDTHLGVCGTYGDTVFVELAAITDVQLADSLSYGTCIEGKETQNTVSGIYTNEALGQYTMHAYTDVPAYILVYYPEGVLVFNCESLPQTEKMYLSLEAAAK